MYLTTQNENPLFLFVSLYICIYFHIYFYNGSNFSVFSALSHHVYVFYAHTVFGSVRFLSPTCAQVCSHVYVWSMSTQTVHGSSNKLVKVGQWEVKWSWLLPPGALGNISAGKWINFTQLNSVSVVRLCPWSCSPHATWIDTQYMPRQALKSPQQAA